MATDTYSEPHLKYIKLAADSIEDLRKIDVYRVLNAAAEDNMQTVIANYIKEKRSDLTTEIIEPRRDLKEAA
ncbi:hypothetical protein [Methylomonas sp. AM2-LC]|uniref:hypothetical protein n=1 Tax=Methylomonas sp. AM2-LC TaxID=3153301 RepID=UPI0032637BAB